MNYNISQIENHIMNILHSMRENQNEPIYMHISSPERQISFTLEILTPQGKVIKMLSDWDTRKMLKKAIRESLQNNGVVDLYHCPDNAIVTFEEYTDKERETSPTGYAQADNFYIHKD